MTDKNREAFEAWWKSPEQAELRKSCAEGWGHYIWQASRQAIEVELPEKLIEEDHYDGGYNCAIKYCSQAITSLGIRVKGERPCTTG